ncbi:BAR domain protein [Oesophagostomum dentatum]|uniref:BAR domain protein n=1 Tax=Oesophagostomum dentatum TaxID=61180 RepID=A0A0B1T1E6_OESDE|nr:BAR domain protein [Oesophagostomum dentatum]
MSLSGLRKQFNKANQYLSETMGAAEATKLDDQYNEMEKHIDTTYELISALIAGTNEYLQPNPATRAKMATMGAISKVRGTVKTAPYPQTEGMLADTMYKYGGALGDNSDLGKALLEAAEAYRHMADIKYQMEENVKHNFLDPLTHLQNNELKGVNHHRTKLKGRRLDYDCKKRQQRRDEELIQAEEKLEESKRLAEMAMFNVLSNDVEQVSQLRALVDAQLDFHRQTTQVLEGLQAQLTARINEASSRPRTEHHPMPVLSNRTPRSRSPAPDGVMMGGQTHTGYEQPSPYSNGGGPFHAPPNALPPQAAPPQQQKPSAKAMFDFEAQSEGELNLKEGQIVELISQIDENWFEGRLNGKSGLFPVTYVQVLVPLR